MSCSPSALHHVALWHYHPGPPSPVGVLTLHGDQSVDLDALPAAPLAYSWAVCRVAPYGCASAGLPPALLAAVAAATGPVLAVAGTANASLPTGTLRFTLLVARHPGQTDVQGGGRCSASQSSFTRQPQILGPRGGGRVT